MQSVPTKAVARKILEAYLAKPGATLEGDIYLPTVEAIRAAYERGLEDAARVAEGNTYDDDSNTQWAAACHQIAAEIRSLKHKEE